MKSLHVTYFRDYEICINMASFMITLFAYKVSKNTYLITYSLKVFRVIMGMRTTFWKILN